LPEIVVRLGVRGALGVLAGVAVAFLFDEWINDQTFIVVIVLTMLVVVVVWEGAQVLARVVRRAREAGKLRIRDRSQREQDDKEKQLSWSNSVAHKVTFGYLEMRYSIPTAVLLKDPQIKNLPFYNDDPAVLPLDVGVFAGEFTKYLVSLDFKREKGQTFEGAYQALFSAGMKGGNKCSTLGDAVDANFRFVDEE